METSQALLIYNMASVEKCPETLTAVNASSKQLNCSIDTYGNNQYMCLPNAEKSSLVEFCYNGIMGIQVEGNCLEAKDGRVILHSCKKFLSGCPKKPFFNYDFYKYPACQHINLKHFCYESDPSCQALENSGGFNNVSNDNRDIMYGLIGGLLVLVILTIVIAGFINERRWKRWWWSFTGVGNEPDRKPDKTSGTTTNPDGIKPEDPLENRINDSENRAQGELEMKQLLRETSELR
uniref:Uncharacterized protein LOC111099463 isoform X2 n=1 Tax=Crassostrea virginica TaxID=6565 RepID=A0A8B8A4P5_CRAVI|nr:uncharacterized protein LOC111099463 isoform X2 [Crassostrea virginica]